MKYKFFIGIDVSKLTLDVAIFRDGHFISHDKIENKEKQVCEWLQRKLPACKAKKSNSLFCLEASGHYTAQLISVLSKRNFSFWVENPLRIKSTLGLKRGKTDKIDSIRIAEYAHKYQKNFVQFKEPREQLKRIRELFDLKRRLSQAQTNITSTLKEKKLSLKIKKEIDSICLNLVGSLKKDVEKTETKILSIINEDERLRRLYQIMTSIVGVGSVLAIWLLIYTNEFLNFSSPKKFACYCGVAPFEYSSGTSLKVAKVSKMANHQMKQALHMPALAAIHAKGDLREYYKRKVAEGHAKMSVLNAVKNKLIHRVFACVRDNRMYAKDYTAQPTSHID